MAELWQAYGDWVIYAALFAVMIGHHFFMGHGGQRGPAGSNGPTGAGHAHGAGADPRSGPERNRHSGGCH